MSEADSQYISCSRCGQILDVSDFKPGDSIECPQCHQTTIVPNPSDTADDSSYAELDGAKIQRIAKLRSAIYRSRSHAIIAALACAGAAIESFAYFLRDVIHFGLNWRLLTPAAIAILGIAGAIFFARRAMALNRELR